MFKTRFVVVKFDEKNKIANAVFGSKDKDECNKKASKYRGIFKDCEQFIKFGVFNANDYDMCVDIERRGLETVYETLPKMSL